MDFDKLYVEVLAGKTIQLRFSTALELRAFLNSFRVFVCRQNKRFKDLGMGDDIDSKGLRTSTKDTVLEIAFLKKERKQYSFQILEVRDNNNPPTEESSEKRES